MSAPQTDAELLKRAVVSLERKLREAGAANAALEQANQAAAREAAELPAVRGRLDEALAATQSLLEDNARLQREAAAARADAEQVQRQRDAAALELQQGAHWRGDAEALEVELTRARGRAEVLGQQVGQLEAANAEVRQDNQRHASQLKEAYQR